MGPEGIGVVPGNESRLLDCPLRVHAEYGDIEEQLHHRRALGITSGCTERHKEFAVLKGYGRVRSQARALPGLKARGMVGVKPRLAAPAGDLKAEAFHNRAARKSVTGSS